MVLTAVWSVVYLPMPFEGEFKYANGVTLNYQKSIKKKKKNDTNNYNYSYSVN